MGIILCCLPCAGAEDRNTQPSSFDAAIAELGEYPEEIGPSAAETQASQQQASPTSSPQPSSSEAAAMQKEVTMLPISFPFDAEEDVSGRKLPGTQVENFDQEWDIAENLMTGELETRHFVLVHGGCFGPWCWYRTKALLKHDGFIVTTVDLTGNGTLVYDTEDLTSVSKYAQPLIRTLEVLDNKSKVILVGHNFGGVCISYAMEMFPSKIAKAVFVSALMPMNGQSTADIFSQQDLPNVSEEIFIYGNGQDQPPTAIDIRKTDFINLLFNNCLPSVSSITWAKMKPMPFAPVMEKLSLSDQNYGSVRRYYVQTPGDKCIPISVQKRMCSSNPPERVVNLEGSDHSPFLSKSYDLHQCLVEIAYM